MSRRVLFHRNFERYSGGHGKVWDYFCHLLALGWDARVHLSADSLLDASNPWLQVPERIETRWRPSACDLLFVAGLDWALVPPDNRKPVINLVQGLRHAQARTRLHEYLSRPAIRICPSMTVAQAITSSAQLTGPVHVIPAAVSLPEGERAYEPTVDLVISADKSVELGMQLRDALEAKGLQVHLLVEFLPRARYLELLKQARAVVCLPFQEEGFYLPALECMALGVPVIVTDAGGNREYALHGQNCIVSDRQLGALLDATLHVLSQPSLASHLRRGGAETAKQHGLEQERARFAEVLQLEGLA